MKVKCPNCGAIKDIEELDATSLCAEPFKGKALNPLKELEIGEADWVLETLSCPECHYLLYKLDVQSVGFRGDPYPEEDLLELYKEILKDFLV